MVDVEIEYCVPCGLLDTAVEVQRELLETFGGDVNGVRLTTGHGGVFRVAVDGEPVWDKDDRGGRVDTAAIAAEVEDRIDAGA